MASKRQLLRLFASSRSLTTSRTLASPISHSLLLPLVSGTFQNHSNPSASQCLQGGSKSVNFIPALLASFFGIRMMDVAYADSGEADSKEPLPPESSAASSNDILQDIAKKERKRVNDLLWSKGGDYSSYPRFTVAVKGQKVAIKFQIPAACEIPVLIAKLVSHLGVKVDAGGSGANMVLRAWDSGVAWQLTLSRPTKTNEVGKENVKQATEVKAETNDLCILFFRPLVGSDKAEIEFMKSGSLTDEELNALVTVLQLAGQRKTAELSPRGSEAKASSLKTTVSNLEAMGVKIYGLSEPNVDEPKDEISWDNLAGYSQQKREIEDTILLALQKPQVYDHIARGTRCKFETNRPRAVLFEGPPGTGKTSSARVIANQAGIPLVYVPLEVISSKWYGQSERSLGKVFSLANEFPNGAIIFLDEVDSFAAKRDGETHEVTRRILSVLLRQMDGFEQDKKVVVVAATNRKEDLDPALVSRFDSMINFGLPDHQTRQEIASQYAKQLTKSELGEFANVTEGMSGRDIKDVCQQAERRWASKVIRGQAAKDDGEGSLPPVKEYLDSALDRQQALLTVERHQPPSPLGKKPQFDFI